LMSNSIHNTSCVAEQVCPTQQAVALLRDLRIRLARDRAVHGYRKRYRLSAINQHMRRILAAQVAARTVAPSGTSR
jgi:hypothetical protein